MCDLPPFTPTNVTITITISTPTTTTTTTTTALTAIITFPIFPLSTCTHFRPGGELAEGREEAETR
ncbi:hypothetical protein E2C01_102624 [Portunus trituberculatus]|uniref:Uncharacterized protein n=1 Tax=Portunus trituberculatus TaxID=210409 RepID=A0A5B7KIX5_PORTR|nr:hypothetical protein [Portunus trituberculatus]